MAAPLCSPRVIFCLGTAKAGTTTLYHCLKSTHQVTLTVPKETWYFDGPDYSSPGARLDYLSRYFDGSNGAGILGEIATSYLFVPYVAVRLAEAFPRSALVAVLRHPIERAYSDWWMMYCSGLEHLRFEDALAENFRRLEEGPYLEDALDPREWCRHLRSIREKGKLLYRTYVDYGHYDLQIARYLQYFPVDSLKVVLFESLFSDIQMGLREILGFLEVDFTGMEFRRIVSNPSYKSPLIRRLVGALARNRLSRSLPLAVRAGSVKLLSQLGSRPSMGASTRSALHEHFDSHLSKLGNLTNLDLSSWRR